MSADLPTSSTPGVPRRKVIPPKVWGPVVLGILATVLATFVYAFHEHRLVKQLTAEKNEMAASLDAAHNLVAALNNRVNELGVKQMPTRPTAARPGGATAVNSSLLTDDAPWKQIQAQLSEQQKQIDAMNNTRAMLQASVAHSHDELEALEKRGQRKYYEFDLGKSNLFHWKGPIALRLLRADTSQHYVDVEIIVGNDQFTKKHVPLYEPVFVYAPNSRQSAELVINGISEDRMHGYVAEAKYRSSGLEALATPGHGQSPSQQTPAPHPRLQPAKD